MASIEPKSFTDRTGQQFTIRCAQPSYAEALLAYIRPVAEETEFFVKHSGLGQETIYRHTDTYKPGTYRFKSDRKQMAIGPGGYVF